MCGLLAISPALVLARGLSLDLLIMLRWYAVGLRHDPAAAPVVVVAIDEESYRASPFRGSPTLTWTREIGRVLTAVVDGGAKVVGFDIVIPTSIEQSEIPFGDEPLGARVRGFDRDFLRALASAAAKGRVVLGEVQNREQPVRPSPGQRIAVGQQRNIRALNAYNDPDDVVRRLPLAFTADGRPVPSMSLELAARALGVAPQIGPDGTTLSGYRIPGAVANTQTLNFAGGGDDVLTYSFADLRACLEKGDADYFRRAFDGKVVLLGTLLETEDRKSTSKRFATGIERTSASPCVLPPDSTEGQFVHRSIAGVYIHATAVNDLIRRQAVIEPGRVTVAAIAAIAAALAAVAAIAFGPLGAAGVWLGALVVYVAGATAVFLQALALPLVEPAFAGTVALALAVGYRFMIADREERFLRKSFALYLAPQVIEQMMESNKLPALGGEMRTITVFFSDLAGFSSFAETMSPGELVALMNEYLSVMTDIVEDNGGYVDKYIGDSIVAVFGAPVDDPGHAASAVRAALQCSARLVELNRTAVSFQGHALAHRIGLNSGEALVGNIGSHRRFNYTVMSDMVNLASRLEGANKYFGTSIMASEMTVALTEKAFAWRELDAIRVKGRMRPVKIYEPLAEAGQESAGQAACAGAYADGLARWRKRDFAGAADAFGRCGTDDPPAVMFRARAQRHVDNPPGPDWEPVNTLEGK